ncbi:MAG: hypothetical protein WCP77_16115 [Roseococcus sp.]
MFDPHRSPPHAPASIKRLGHVGKGTRAFPHMWFLWRPFPAASLQNANAPTPACVLQCNFPNPTIAHPGTRAPRHHSTDKTTISPIGSVLAPAKGLATPTRIIVMSTSSNAAQGDIALTILRFSLLATASTLVGVLGHIAWKAITG